MVAHDKCRQTKAKQSLDALGKSRTKTRRITCRPLLRKGLILGQAPPGPKKSLPKGWKPLDGPIGDRLSRLAGLAGGSQELWKAFDRRNVIEFFPGEKTKPEHQTKASGYDKHMSTGDLFPLDTARKEAAKIPIHRRPIVVLCGLNVTRAFGLSVELLSKQHLSSGTLVLTLPHPSGVSHFWNEPKNVYKAARALRAAIRMSGLLPSSRMKGSPIVGPVKKQPVKKLKAVATGKNRMTIKKQHLKKSSSGKGAPSHANPRRRYD